MRISLGYDAVKAVRRYLGVKAVSANQRVNVLRKKGLIDEEYQLTELGLLHIKLIKGK